MHSYFLSHKQIMVRLLLCQHLNQVVFMEDFECFRKTHLNDFLMTLIFLALNSFNLK